MTKKRVAWEYAVYKGDELVCMGTSKEICDALNISRNTFSFYRSNWYRENRETEKNNRRIIIRTDGEDKIWHE
jgi:hypothetical protein